MNSLPNHIVFILLTIFSTPISSIFKTDPPFYAQKYASIKFARSIIFDDIGDIIVSTRKEESRIYLLYEEINPINGSVTIVQDILVDAPQFQMNHGLALNKGFLYVSNSTTVFRWPYHPGRREPLDPTHLQVAIFNIPPEGFHPTRTILFGPDDLLYVQVGSLTDVDPDSSRSKIYRFNLTDDMPEGGIDFQTGEVFADGVRNHVGLGFDPYGVLWGLENGVNQPERPDLGVDTWLGNPAEELNRFDQPPGTHYGYPYCFSSHVIQGYPNNTQFVYPDFMENGIQSDPWCQDPANNQPPVLALASHTAPLGIQFYTKTEVCDVVEGSFPCEAINDAFITFHATEYLENPTFYGNRVSWLRFDPTSKEPTGEFITVIYEEDVGGGNCGGPCFKPVNAVFDKRGHLIISVDWAGEIYRVTYNTPPPTITNNLLKY